MSVGFIPAEIPDSSIISLIELRIKKSIISAIPVLVSFFSRSSPLFKSPTIGWVRFICEVWLSIYFIPISFISFFFIL